VKARRRSLADYLAAEMPAELQWFNRPGHGWEEDYWRERRQDWARAHRVDMLDLIRHDVAQLRAMGTP
jgi:hypothetical protein